MSDDDGEAAGLIPEHVKAYHSDTVRVGRARGKGRVLYASQDFEPGERILLESPLVEVRVQKSAPAYRALLRLQDEGALEYPPFFYWASLCTLTAADVTGAYLAPWPTVPAYSQAQALELHMFDVVEPSPSFVRVVAALWPPGSGPDPVLLERLLQSWAYNSFDCSYDGEAGGVIYLAVAMISHSCSPNAAWHQDEEDSFILIARAPIACGEEITLSYLSQEELCRPTPERRRILAASKAFHCSCERCSSRHDDVRTFVCPACHRLAFAVAAALTPGDPSVSGSSRAVEGVECSVCGLLGADSAAALLALEAETAPLALEAVEDGGEGTSQQPDAAPTDVASSSAGGIREMLRRAEDGGLATTSWIIDELRAAVCRQDGPDAGLLRLRIEASDSLGSLAIVKRARLRLELGGSLARQADAGALAEAAEVYSQAAQMLALVFGDDHPEYQEAESLRDQVEQKRSRAVFIKATRASGPSGAGLLGRTGLATIVAERGGRGAGRKHGKLPGRKR